MATGCYGTHVCKIMAMINKNLHMARNVNGYFSANIICSETRTVFRAKLQENCEVKEQIMSKDKYLCVFSRQTGPIVFIIFQRILVSEQLTLCCLGCLHFFCTTLSEQNVLSSKNSHKLFRVWLGRFETERFQWLMGAFTLTSSPPQNLAPLPKCKVLT